MGGSNYAISVAGSSPVQLSIVTHGSISLSFLALSAILGIAPLPLMPPKRENPIGMDVKTYRRNMTSEPLVIEGF